MTFDPRARPAARDVKISIQMFRDGHRNTQSTDEGVAEEYLLTSLMALNQVHQVPSR